MMVVTSVDAHAARHTRRWLLTRLMIVGGASLASPALPSRLALADVKCGDGENYPLAQAKVFMAHAFKMRRIAVEAGDQPYGAVIVKDNQIVGDGPSRVVTKQDPTAHAEMEAIRDAARYLRTRDLGGCVIYATSKPCRMCETASYWAKLSRIYFSAAVTDGGRPRYSSC